MTRPDELVEVEIVDPVLAQTDKAILVIYEGERHWIPLSIIDPESEVMQRGDQGTLVIPRWFAVKNGIDP